MTTPFFSTGDGLRKMFLESDYGSVEAFLASLECPDDIANLEGGADSNG